MVIRQVLRYMSTLRPLFLSDSTRNGAFLFWCRLYVANSTLSVLISRLVIMASVFADPLICVVVQSSSIESVFVSTLGVKLGEPAWSSGLTSVY